MSAGIIKSSRRHAHKIIASLIVGWGGGRGGGEEAARRSLELSIEQRLQFCVHVLLACRLNNQPQIVLGPVCAISFGTSASEFGHLYGRVRHLDGRVRHFFGRV